MIYAAIVLGSLISLVILLRVIAFFLPARTVVERQVTIQSDLVSAFNFLADFRQWPQWFEWMKPVDISRISYSDHVRTKNTWMRWRGREHHNAKGSVVLHEMRSPDWLVFRIDLPGAPEFHFAVVRFEDLRDKKTRVTWLMDEVNTGWKKYRMFPLKKRWNRLLQMSLDKLKKMMDQR